MFRKLPFSTFGRTDKHTWPSLVPDLGHGKQKAVHRLNLPHLLSDESRTSVGWIHFIAFTSLVIQETDFKKKRNITITRDNTITQDDHNWVKTITSVFFGHGGEGAGGAAAGGEGVAYSRSWIVLSVLISNDTPMGTI